MVDFFRECNSGDLKIDPKTFTETWCVRCHRPDCDLAELARLDPMAERNATWRKRFFGAQQADLSVPKYAQVAQLDFPDLLRKAMKLEVSERRGDWTVPEIPVLDGRIERAPKDTTSHVDAAVRSLASRGVSLILDEPEPDLTEPDDEDDSGLEDDEEDLEPEDSDSDLPEPDIRVPIQPRPVQAPPSSRNTPDPGEVMIGGAPAPAAQQRGRPMAETDPWAPAPQPTVVIVKSGAKIQFGAGGKTKVVDG